MQRICTSTGIWRGWLQFTSLKRMSTSSSFSLDGKVALVTGSSGRDGIGFAIAESLAQRGCSLVLTGSRQPEKVEDVKTTLTSKWNVPVDYIAADLIQMKNIDKLYKDIKKIHAQGVDILVNNAATPMHVSPIESIPFESWEMALRINLSVPFRLIQLFLPEMKIKGWARIVNISSLTSLRGFPEVAPSTSSKHGLNGLTKVVALESLGSGVTCNGVCPSAVNTRSTRDYFRGAIEKLGISFDEEKEKQALTQCNPSGQYVKTEQVGELVAFLCSPAADQMTGTLLPIDAGLCAK
ncbi:D-beta-hydroxybutyrate dehydrogenase-like [Ptychodera flava]|uniref:D-beta-hydroxybutyrate dehydrogenase-like n=1 Tax=Ptychodera flava TaxID=63121 RepID=UPI00396A84BC